MGIVYRWTLLLWVVFFMVLVSCTTRGPPITVPVPVIPEPPKEIPPPAAIPEPPPALVSIDEAVKKVKANSPEIIKSVAADSVEHITVLGELNGYRVVYDLRNAVSLDERRFLVAFSVEDPLRNERREDSFFWTPEADNAGILLSMDDNYHDDWKAYFDLFDRYGAKITFFVQGELCPFCREARDRGHDIGYHTRNHLNLTKVSPEVFRSETLSGLDDFRSAGIPLHAFAYPYGLSEPWMIETLSTAFGLQRGYGVRFHIYRKEKINGYIASTALDNILFKEDSQFEQDLFFMLFTTKFLGKDHIASFTTHDISDTAQWGIKPARLEYLFKIMQEFNLKFYRFSDLTEEALARADYEP
ncbi:polysaccharide deacetylase family protein [Treponema sp. TIM-1]|uniref:polysaccharide deacetylase family protein n=1 Tax=Treponema sp. TIM-1 TaxID=2898417 RepID=UPI0039809488